MILVMLGTQNNSFYRLLEEIDRLIEIGKINDEVIVQAGYTKYESQNMKIIDFVSSEEIEKLEQKANCIITHGGVGSIIASLKKGKKVIVVPRQKKYGEHVNNHQLQIAKKFEQDGYVKYALDLNELGNIILEMKDFKPKKFENNKSNVVSIVENFIDNN